MLHCHQWDGLLMSRVVTLPYLFTGVVLMNNSFKRYDPIEYFDRRLTNRKGGPMVVKW